jgi:hypothetical protein
MIAKEDSLKVFSRVMNSIGSRLKIIIEILLCDGRNERIAKMKSNSKILRLTFGSLWTLGWVCIIMLIATVTRDFRTSSNLEEQALAISNPQVSKLVVTSSLPFTKKYYGRNWIKFEPFENLIDDDTAYVRNVYVEIAKSANDSFQVTMKKTARGNTKAEANALANLIKFDVTQKDSILLLEKGIAINKTDKFRNQMVIVTVYVPVGKQIRINKGIGWPVHFGPNRDWNDNWDNDYYDSEEDIRWQSDVDYVMKADGLYTLDGRKADGWNDREKKKSTNNKRTYRYNAIEDSLQRRQDSIDNRKQLKVDSIERRLQQQKDSIERHLEIEKSKIENGNARMINNEAEELSAIVMPGVDILPGIN